MLELVSPIFWGIVFIALLIISAEYVVKKLIRIAHHFGVSGTFIGLTVLSVGTSLPEIASHLMASVGILRGTLDYKIASSTVLGANIGSDVIQQTLILGLVILLFGKMVFPKKFLVGSYLPMIGTTLMCLILGWDQHYSRIDGLILVGTFFAYMIYLYKTEKREKVSLAEKKRHIGIDILLTFGGMAVLLISSAVVLRIIENLVHEFNIGGSLIGVMSLGIASALPELITAIEGYRKKASGMSVGTLIGSNITNPLVAIGGGALISTYFVPLPLIYWDLPMETITAALLLVYLLLTGRTLKRAGAVYLILLYFFYAVIRIVYFPLD